MTSSSHSTNASRFAHGYDLVMRIVEKLGLAELRRSLLSGVSGKVLEIGPGTGLNIPYLSSEVELTCVEPNPEMVTILRSKLMGREIELFTTSFEDLATESLAKNQFDFIISTLVLCSVRDLPGSLVKISELLKPGGECLFIEHVATPGLYAKLQNWVTPTWSRLADGCHLNRDIIRALDDSPLVVTSLRKFRFPLGWPLIPYGIIGKAKRRSDFFG